MKIKCYSNFNSGVTGNYLPSFLLIKDENEDNDNNKDSDYENTREIKDGEFFPDFRKFLK